MSNRFVFKDLQLLNIEHCLNGKSVLWFALNKLNRSFFVACPANISELLLHLRSSEVVIMSHTKGQDY